MKACAGCAHFAQNNAIANGSAHGECRAHPPLAVPVQVQGRLAGQAAVGFTSGWPPVQGSQWCGEFKPEPGSAILKEA